MLTVTLEYFAKFIADWGQNFKTGSPLDSLVSSYLDTPKGDLEGDRKREMVFPSLKTKYLEVLTSISSEWKKLKADGELCGGQVFASS